MVALIAWALGGVAALQLGPRLVDVDQIVEFPVSLYKKFLKQILGLGLLARKTPCETVQPVEVRSYEFLKR